MDNSIMNAALEYASKGWSVIPISRDKQPLIKWKNATREELTDPEAIKSWWKKYPSANVAIVTGKRSGGLVVIDLDIDDKKGIDGKDSLQKWCDENDMFCLESCATVETGRGGQHLYFQSDNDYHNQVGCLDGVDIRGEGGCVVAPPSIHGSTRRTYSWDIEDDDVIVPKADSDVTFFLASMEMKNNSKEPAEEKKNDFTKITKEGGRNNQLFKYLARLQGDGETNEAIKEYAHIYNKTHLIPPLDDEEVDRTIESVLSHSEWKGTRAAPAAKNDHALSETKRKRLKVKTAAELMAKNVPKPKVFVGVDSDAPLLMEGTCLLASKPKIGKSLFVMALCMALCEGKPFLGFKTQKCSALYLDLEIGDALEKERVRDLLAGVTPPSNLYLTTLDDEERVDLINNGFVEQIEDFIKEYTDIGVVVVDVFQKVRPKKMRGESDDYERAYNEIGPLNKLAGKYHISIILVSHLRKGDSDDPYDNILGSTGLQGAVSQMIVMSRQRTKDGGPIHINITGKAIKGMPEFNVKLNENAQWIIVNGENEEINAQAELLNQYRSSSIRMKIVDFIEKTGPFNGRCADLITAANNNRVYMTESPKSVGWFLTKHQAHFYEQDGIEIQIINNGTGGKIYKIKQKNVDNVDENVDEFINADKYKHLGIPFI